MSLSASLSTTSAKTHAVSSSSPRLLPRRPELTNLRLDVDVMPGFGVGDRVMRQALDEISAVEAVARLE